MNIETFKTMAGIQSKQAEAIETQGNNLQAVVDILAEMASRIRALEMRNGIEHATEQKDIFRDRPLAQDKAAATIHYINEIRENRYEA